MSELFNLCETNPNDSVGGGGCACSEQAPADQQGPYVVFYASESTSSVSPHVVVCAPCIDAAQRQIAGGKIVGGGESGEVIDAEATEIPEL